MDATRRLSLLSPQVHLVLPWKQLSVEPRPLPSRLRSLTDSTNPRSWRKAADKVVDWLAKNASWDAGRVYTVNVPVKDGVEKQPVVWASMLQNQWSSSSCFEATAGVVDDADTEETKLRRQESREGEEEADGKQKGDEADKWAPRHYKWSPKFTDVYSSVEAAGPGSDGWAVKEGQTSVTALYANFSHVQGYNGEIKL